MLGGGVYPQAGHAVGQRAAGDAAFVGFAAVAVFGAGGVAAQDAAVYGGAELRHGVGAGAGQHVAFHGGGQVGVQVVGGGADGVGFDGGDPAGVQGGEGGGQPVHEVAGVAQVVAGGGVGDVEGEGDFGGEEFVDAGVVGG